MTDNHPDRAGVLAALADEKASRRLTSPMVDAGEVIRYGSFVGSVIECHPRLARAMDRARQLIAEVERAGGSIASGTVILADTMSRSKGRFDRVWHAPAGGVWGCLIHVNTLLDQSRSFVPLAAGLSCCQAVHDAGGSGARLRWVNDVLCGGRKVAGFLVESCTGPVYREVYNLVGFGINVNNVSFPGELAGTATSLSQILGKELDITAFTTAFLAKLAWNFGLIYHEEHLQLHERPFSGPDGRHLLLHDWLMLSDTVGRRVRYGFDVMNAPQYEATVTGLTPEGGLQMRLEDGTPIVEYSGEIRYLSSPP